MTILIDPPQAPGHGRLWSHLASDTSYAELHAFARAAGIPERGFDRDHYDVPAEHYDRVVSAGAEPVSSRELVRRLHAGGLRRRKSDALRPRRPGRPLVLPRLLQPGDLVAFVSPAGPSEAERVAAGQAILESWGLEVLARPGLPAVAETWLAGPDEARAHELESAWGDVRVRAVFATRGGFGSQRMLDLVDWRSMALQGPAWLVGFSDITAVHQAFAARLGVATLHGPVVASLPTMDPVAVEALRRLLFDGEMATMSGTPAGGGVASGPLVGGNLAVLAASAGTPGVHAARDSIALLEDVTEEPYRLDRLVTQLLRSGWFEGVRGVALGQFTDCGDPEEVRRLLRSRLAPLGVPLVLDLPIGHTDDTRSVVLGRRATLDGDAGTLAMPGPDTTAVTAEGVTGGATERRPTTPLG
jgi:muramoyltetrapeptide carboxypeptidase